MAQFSAVVDAVRALHPESESLACDLAVIQLRKAKPRLIDDGRCPRCNTRIIQYGWYCAECGQALRRIEHD